MLNFSCLAPFGRLINFGNPTGGSTSIEAFTLVNNNHILQGFGLASYFEKPDLMQDAYQYLFSQAATGKLKVHIGQTFPFKRQLPKHTDK